MNRRPDLAAGTVAVCHAPSLPEMEEAILGALLVEPQAVAEVEHTLRPEMFFDNRHREVYQAILEKRERNEKIDLLTVTEELRRKGTLEETGGAFFIAQLSGRMASGAHLEEHASIVRQYYLRRELIVSLHKMLARASDLTEEVYDTLNAAQEALNRLQQDCPWQEQLKEMPVVMEQTYSQAEARMLRSKDGVTGIPSGLSELDRLTGGWQPGNEIVLAAKTGHGKTALALHFARHAAKAGKHVLVCSLEMTAAELGSRWMLSECEVDPYRWRAGKATPQEMALAQQTTQRLKELPIHVHDAGYASIDDICATAKSLHARRQCDMVIIDYLQLCHVKQAGRNREQEVAESSRKAKMLARQLACPVIVLSQLNREADNRPGQVPRLSDLRESGAIEQDADMVILLYRPEKAGIPTDKESGYPTRGLGIGILAKHRNGECGKVYFSHNPSMTKLTDYQTTHEWLAKQGQNLFKNGGETF